MTELLDQLFKFEGSTNDKTAKQQAWNAIAQRVDAVVDGLGMPIDSGIREAIVALNALGVNTSQSCQGHLDWGIAGPWVDIQAKITQSKPSLEESAKAFKFLSEFYAERKTNFDQMLHLIRLGSGVRLQCQGTDFQALLSEDERKKNLLRYQLEMEQFASFLKQKFFNS